MTLLTDLSRLRAVLAELETAVSGNRYTGMYVAADGGGIVKMTIRDADTLLSLARDGERYRAAMQAADEAGYEHFPADADRRIAMAYQAVGSLASHAGLFEHETTVAVLDALSDPTKPIPGPLGWCAPEDAPLARAAADAARYRAAMQAESVVEAALAAYFRKLVRGSSAEDNKACSRMSSALAAASIRAEAEGWRTIESAPKDGMPILAYVPNGAELDEHAYCWPEGMILKIVPVVWHEPNERTCAGSGWYVPWFSVGFGVWDDPSTDFYDVQVEPTHWRPLPSPPKE